MKTNLNTTRVGLVDEAGHLYCQPCARELEVPGFPIYFDARPHNVGQCEACKEAVVTGWFSREHLPWILSQVKAGHMTEAEGTAESRRVFGAIMDMVLKG